jgi:hypothetical protein
MRQFPLVSSTVIYLVHLFTMNSQFMTRTSLQGLSQGHSGRKSSKGQVFGVGSQSRDLLATMKCIRGQIFNTLLVAKKIFEIKCIIKI